VLDEIEGARKRQSDDVPRIPTKIRLAPPENVYIGDPLCNEFDSESQLKECALRGGKVYSLQIAEIGVLKRLEELASASSYYCFEAKSETGAYRMPMENGRRYACAYLRRLSLDHEASPVHIVSQPRYWLGTFEGRVSEAIWVSTVIGVDKAGLPLSAKYQVVEPVAVETSKNLYLVAERESKSFLYSFEHEREGAAIGADTQALFSVPPACSAACVDFLEREYLAQTQKSLKKDPVAADVKVLYPPMRDELVMKRDYQKSQILGEPFFEISRYRIRCYLYSNTINSNREHLLLVSPNLNGEYSEASPQQRAKYESVLGQIRQSVLIDSCKKFEGVIVDGLCSIKKAPPRPPE
jgi:hypothetical protein